MTDRLAACGAACLASGLLGILVGLVTIAWPASVPESQWSHPFPTTVGLVVGLVLAVTHLLTAAGFVGVLEADPHRGSRPAVVTLWIAVGGYVLLAIAELLSGGIGGRDVDSSAAGAVGGVFAVASLMTALGGVVAGVIIVRRGVWSGVGRWAVLASGVTMLVLVTPANAAGAGTVVRTLALLIWSSTFVVLGAAIRRGRASTGATGIAESTGSPVR